MTKPKAKTTKPRATKVGTSAAALDAAQAACEAERNRSATLAAGIASEVDVLKGYLENGMGRGEITPMIERLEAVLGSP